MTKIAIIDYHLSNMFSLQNALFHLGFHSKVTSNKKEILYSDIAILPGVGSFPIAMEKLKKLELIDTIKEFIDSVKFGKLSPISLKESLMSVDVAVRALRG